LKHVTINVSEEIKNVLPDTLEKDLQDNERICSVCHGLGMRLSNNIYGIKGDTSEVAKHKRFPYNHQALSFCPNCYNGVIEICEYCGKQLPRGITKCNCEMQKEKDKEERRIKYQEKIDRAKEIFWSETTAYYVYDENSDKYFTDEGEFAENYWELYLENPEECNNFEEYFDKYIPKILWNCYAEYISMDADSIIESACEELYEEADDYISDEARKELQQLLDEWCKKQTGTATYYPDYKKYIKVDRKWFYEE
jgi:hypothetical protein